MAIGVHGFSFDPKSPTNNPTDLYAAWAEMLGQPIDGFAWYSSPLGVKGEMRALLAGYTNQYAYAFKSLAPTAAQELAFKLDQLPIPQNIICHSLGSRVALEAISTTSCKISRIIILDGAEIQPNVKSTLPIGTQVLNCCAREDKVLSALGTNFNDDKLAPCIGQAGLGRKMDGWIDIFLDDPVTQAKAKTMRGWDIGASPRHQLFSGDVLTDLRNIGDHWASYANTNNRPIYRSFMAGDNLKDII